MMGWGNIYWRRLKVFTAAVIIFLDYKTVQKRVGWFSMSKKEAIWEKAHRRNARRVLKLIIELEGMWVKLGQYLSTRADVLPIAYIRALQQLQDSLPPRKLEEVRGTIQKELGSSIDELFSAFVEAPLATASIAQVHRATLKDGREVVVKVQHEGIKEIILEDLRNTKSLADWIAWADPNYDFNPLINEWCKEAPKELDFNHEAENTRKVSRNLRCKTETRESESLNHVDVLIPEIIQSSEKALILEYMDGIRLNDNETLEACAVDKQKIVEEITRAYAHQIYVDGFFNGDPHPGNFLVSKERPHRPILLDFGLTKSISTSMKQALAKMFLACAEGNHVALLSAFAEMGLKLRLDMPDQVMDFTTVFFRTSAPTNETLENVKTLRDRGKKNFKAIKEKLNLNDKEFKHFNPVDAFPEDAVIFMRVLNLLQGLSSAMNVRIVYLDIMRPFAESALHWDIPRGPTVNTEWIYDSPIRSDVEAKLRQLLVELGRDKVLGLQVCAYKDGEVVIDTAAGVLGRYDPRPVQPDSLFPVFSVTKGITAGMVHWLVDKGKIKLDEAIANIWPEFRSNGKDSIKVHHVLNHTSGLHNTYSDIRQTDPLSMCDWEASLEQIAMATPETEPGSKQLYHSLSFGWLCGGIIEHSSGKKFQDILEEAIIHPLNLEGELYIGIPPGVESRLATLMLDPDDLEKLAAIAQQYRETPTNLDQSTIVELVSSLTLLFNTLNFRRAILPAANGHCSARALARYYASLAIGGSIPPPHPANSKPHLGSHTHKPKFLSSKRKGSKQVQVNGEYNCKPQPGRAAAYNDGYNPVATKSDEWRSTQQIFTNPKIHDQFMGTGDYEKLVLPGEVFGLGFRRFCSADGRLTCFGHSGIGGSTGFCDIEHNFAIAVTLNKMSLGGVTRSIIQLVCKELGVPLSEEFSTFGRKGPDMQLNMEQNG